MRPPRPLKRPAKSSCVRKAYKPPHKRYLSSSTSSKSSFFKKEKSSKYIIYAKDAISMWVPIGLLSSSSSSDDDDDKQLQFMTHLEPFSSWSSNSIINGQKPLVLVLNHHAFQEGRDRAKKFLADPWNFVAENAKHDLLSSFERVKNEMWENETERVKPALVARIGKVLFHWGPSPDEDFTGSNSMSESALRKLRKTFYTNVPPLYVDYVINEVVPLLGCCFVSEKDVYHVKISDDRRHDTTISCKCVLGKDSGKLELRKVELNAVRHYVVDMSCLDKRLDLRLMLCTKRTVVALTDDEIKIIKRLVSYATVEPEVKGGLRWPLGRNSLGDQYTVVGVWHTTAKSFGNSSIRVKIRKADRFDFRSSIGECTGEVTIKMHGIVSQLLNQDIQTEVISTMLKENLRFIWEHCL